MRSIDGRGKQSEPSAPGKLSVLLPAPQVKPLKPVTQKFTNKKAADLAKTTADITWSKLPYAVGYELEVAKNPQFKESKKVKLRANSKSLNVKAAGFYHFRVRAIDSAGKPLSGYSNVAELQYNKEE